MFRENKNSQRVAELEQELATLKRALAEKEARHEADSETASLSTLSAVPTHWRYVEKNAETITGALFEPMSFAYNAGGLMDGTQSELAELHSLLAQITASIRQNQALVGALEEHTRAIQQFVENIQKIASQSRMLSLNAAIEAARVGRQGKSFAVVADEIGNLSQSAGRFADDIANQLGEIDGDTRQTRDFIDGLGSQIERIEQLSTSVTESSSQTASQTKDLQKAAYSAMAAGHIIGVISWACDFYARLALAVEAPDIFEAPEIERDGNYLGQWLFHEQDNEFQFREQPGFKDVENAYLSLLACAEDALRQCNAGKIEVARKQIKAANEQVSRIARGMTAVEQYLNRCTRRALDGSAKELD